MSVNRFIRCTHCGLPHEAQQRRCPETGKAIDPPAKKPSRISSRPPAMLAEAPIPLVPRAAPAPSTLVGQVVEGTYRIDAELGRGGMGVVYAAEHVRLEKQVAVKVLGKPYAPGTVAEKRFVREARVAGSLGHPNIVQVFDLGTLPDGSPFLAMERLDGETLSQRIAAHGAIDIEDAIEIAEQVLSALVAAHAKGIVHRDVKPENVFLTREGGVKLLDFGISKNVADVASTLTQAGVVVGTPYYLAPEQARADHLVDGRTDLWGVGATLYEALTGRVPFKGKNLSAVLVAILEDELKPPSMFRPRISAELEEVVVRAMKKEPAERYADAEAMLAALHDVRVHRRGIGPEPTLTTDTSEEASTEVTSTPPAMASAGMSDPHITIDDPTEVDERDEFEVG